MANLPDHSYYALSTAKYKQAPLAIVLYDSDSQGEARQIRQLIPCVLVRGLFCVRAERVWHVGNSNITYFGFCPATLPALAVRHIFT